MKLLRLFVVTVFVFTLFIVPAQAQGAEEYGFAPLLTEVNPNIPLHVQARRAFDRLLPILLEAQQNGIIRAFEPKLSAGVLKIAYPAGARTSTLGKITILDSMQAARKLVPYHYSTGAKATAFNPVFHFFLYDDCFYAYDLGDSSHVVGGLYNASGRLLANYAGDADTTGYLEDCLNYDGLYGNVLPGYKLTFKVYDTLSTLLGTYTVTVPTVAITSYDTKNSVIRGTGPKNKPYYISWYHDNLDAGDTNNYIEKNRTIGANGSWSTGFGSKDFRGGDEFLIGVDHTAHFGFGLYYSLPYIHCIVGSNYCSNHGMPFAAATINIIHAGVTHTFTGRFSSSGRFVALLEDNKGAPILLTAGDKVNGTGVSTFPLVWLSAAANYTTNRVAGIAPANKYFRVWAQDDCYCWYDVWAHSNSLKRYSADFTLDVDLVANKVLLLEVYYIDPATGNVTDLYRVLAP